MFDDIPEELNQWVLNAPEELREPYAFGNLAIQAVIAFYLGKLLDRKAAFLDFPDNSPGRIPWQQTIRLTQIAQALFVLRRQPGFREVCRRLGTREDMRSAAFEAFAAQMFGERGFSVMARPETGRLGEDFDFAVRADDGMEINVEATSLTVRSFSEGTIMSALRKKRSQLPNDKPAVIVCFLPGTWREQIGDLVGVLTPIALRFLRGTKRINHLVFCEDLMSPFEKGGSASFHIIGFRNHFVRFAAPRLDRMIVERLWNDKEVTEFLSSETPEGFSGSSELFHWIEWLKCRLA
ncbi:hypothetical protein [Sphingomonas alba]|uniref:Restriction endonuclease n=1 Tax=Sphingomonas alba TaxID=2908208 RepID=A0ABT0RP90_9SPHN|nr:hypothetical protein [Sphingomonas alba]MCL6684469.1 hypothetical protein [Sphingomonas alba]